jgi:hypothetical protein
MKHVETPSVDLSTIAIRRPRPTEWFRIRPETSTSFVCRGLYHRGRFFIVQGDAVVDAIGLHTPRRVFGVARNHAGALFLWPLSLHHSDAPDAFIQARETAKSEWTRLQWNWEEDDGPSLRILTTGPNFHLPPWPTASLLEIVLEACSGRYICRPDHPVINEIKSSLHNTLVPNTAA